MMKFRKKSETVETVEVVQLKQDNWNEVFAFINKVNGDMLKYNLTPEGILKIKTSEGDVVVDITDWIIKGTKDRFYFCTSDQFEKTYELVEHV